MDVHKINATAAAVGISMSVINEFFYVIFWSYKAGDGLLRCRFIFFFSSTNRRMLNFILLPSGGLIKSSVVSVSDNSAGIFVDPGVRVDGFLPISYHPAGMLV